MRPSFGFDHKNSKQLCSTSLDKPENGQKKPPTQFLMQRQRRKRELKMKNSRLVAVLHEARASKTLFFPTFKAEMNFIDFICSIFQFLLMPCRDASLPQTLSPRRLPGGRPFHFALPPRLCFSLCFSFFSLLLSVWHCLGF